MLSKPGSSVVLGRLNMLFASVDSAPCESLAVSRTMVIRALRDSGRRKMLTPLEMASTPVSATAPDEKPFSRMKMVRVPPKMLPPACLNGNGLMRWMSSSTKLRNSP